MNSKVLRSRGPSVEGPVFIYIGVRDLRDLDDYEFFVSVPSPPAECDACELLTLEVRARWPDVRFKTYNKRVASFMRNGALIVAELQLRPSAEARTGAEQSLAFPPAAAQPDLFGESQEDA